MAHDHECGCGCGCEHDEEPIIINLEFDDGETIECEPLFIFDVEGSDYVALVPTDETNDEVFLYAYHELSEDEFEFLDIDSDEVYDKVVAEFERIMEEAEALDEAYEEEEK